MSRDAPCVQAWRPIDSPTITSCVAKFRAITLIRERVRRLRLKSKCDSARCVLCRRSADGDLVTRDFIAPKPGDRRASALAETSLPRPTQEWRNSERRYPFCRLPFGSLRTLYRQSIRLKG